MSKIDYEKAIYAQRLLSHMVKVEHLEINRNSIIGGVDVSYSGDSGIAAYVSMQYGSIEPSEIKYARVSKLPPYIPGLLYLREVPVISKIFHQINRKPDVLLVNGHGLAHPRKMGLASYIGVIFNIPTIGVARRLLYGQIDWSSDLPLIIVDNEPVGTVLTTESNNKIYISIGHRVTLNDAIKVVKENIFKLNLPAPIWYADKLSRKIAKKKNEEINSWI
ncbi:MAG: endonuclease V [Thermoprotei archaeon]